MKKTLLLLGIVSLPFMAVAQALNVTITTTNASCNSNCDGTATATPTGGTAPYTYLWSPQSATTQVVSGLCAGAYTVTVTDAAMATATATCVIGQPNVITVSPTANPASVCSGTSVTCVTNAVGGTPPYTCNWAPMTYITFNSCNMTCVPLSNITYTLTVTDGNGCTAMGLLTINVYQSPTVTTSEVPSTCNGNNGQINTSVTGGTPPYAFLWMPGNITTANVVGASPNTTYSLSVTDMNGCTTSGTQPVTDSCDYVWPGDANDDAVADNIDILDIGIANGATGTTRANASLTWIGQPSAPWGQTLLSGTDYKWVDCDGNGTINPVDTQAVVLNYGMTHNNRVGAPVNTLTAPALSISFDQDSLEGGSSGTITLALGDAMNQATGVYGIGFRLNYDAAQLNTSTFGMTGGTTWFGTPGSDMMRVILHPSPANGYVDVAITRYDQQDVSGFGTLGQIYFTTTTALNGTGNSVVVPMSVSNVILVNSTGAQQPVNVMNDSVVVADTSVITGVVQHSTSPFEVYPNPASDNIQIVIPGSEQQLVTIEDLSGRIVYSENHPAGTNTISVSELPAGTYLLHVGAGEDAHVERITIAR